MYENKKLIAQFICKLRDESFKPSYFIIRQCLSNKNKIATVSFSKNFYELNKAFSLKKSTFRWC